MSHYLGPAFDYPVGTPDWCALLQVTPQDKSELRPIPLERVENYLVGKWRVPHSDLGPPLESCALHPRLERNREMLVLWKGVGVNKSLA